MYIKLSESSSNKPSTGFPWQASDPLGLAPSGTCTTPWSRVVRHQPAELGEVDLPVPVHVRLGDHVPHLGLGQRLAQVGHGQPELLLGDEAVAVAVEHLERVHHVVLNTVRPPLHHHFDELIEVYRPVGVCVHIADHVLQVFLGRVEPVSAHHLKYKKRGINVGLDISI